MKILCVIPSRMHSTRLERKPLLPIQGKPMVQWTYENAVRCKHFHEVIVATDHPDIFNSIESIGGKAVMTDPTLPNGSSRVAAVAKDYPDMDVVVNLQGDEPFIQPHMLTSLIAPYLQGETIDMTTLASPLDMETDYHRPSAVKVITDLQGNALYFSRAAIPHFRMPHGAPVYHHMGLYAFRYDFLMTYAALPETPLEQVECLEQLRVLEHGYQIRVCLTQGKSLEINTPEEYEQAQHFEYLETE